jgi:hypothetical protein
VRRCRDCRRPCSRGAWRCRACSNRRNGAARRGRPRPASHRPYRGVPVVGLDGETRRSMSELARELGCTRTALYPYADWVKDHWQVWRYPDPRNIGGRPPRP